MVQRDGEEVAGGVRQGDGIRDRGWLGCGGSSGGAEVEQGREEQEQGGDKAESGGREWSHDDGG